jgi:hypothetical protein
MHLHELVDLEDHVLDDEEVLALELSPLSFLHRADRVTELRAALRNGRESHLGQP